ncbi:MAG: hypothetical protein H6713_42735 [Myxococcales bacterium]|nr:hypothetical protein [Myxococcales bacterium]
MHSPIGPQSVDKNVLRPTFNWVAGELELLEQNNPKLWTLKLGQLDALFGT